MIARQKPQSPITVSATVGEDHRLIIDIPLPPDAPSGKVEVELVVRPLSSKLDEPINPALEIAREKMRAAGRLSTAWHQDELEAALDDEALWELVKLAPNSVSSDQLIDKDRGINSHTS
jgi:hypothetical protein